MRRDGDVWRSSFTVPAGDSDVINDNQSVLTVFSASKGTGGHASMFLERFRNGEPECLLIDLTEGGGAISIVKSKAQIIKGDQSVINMSLPKGGDPEALRGAHYHCYVLDGTRTEAVLAAVEKFKNKVQKGRYVYRAPGGVLGWLSSVPRTRGVNCADFVIKILRDAEVKNVAYLLFDTPFRVAK